MKTHFGFVLLAAGLVVAGCDNKKTPTAPAAEAPKQLPAGENPITAPVDYVGAAVKAEQTALKKIDTASITSAIQLFNAQEGRFPKDLDELVQQKYIPKLPALPPGMKFKYDAAKGEVSVVKQ